jgi:hypothetical protein
MRSTLQCRARSTLVPSRPCSTRGPPYEDDGVGDSETDEGHEWSASTAKLAAGNLVAVARALAATPVPAPRS